MELGLGALGLSPLVFWSLTPRELQQRCEAASAAFQKAMRRRTAIFAT